MKYGFIKVGSAIPDLHVADCAYNAEKITELAMRADENGVVALAFPELSLTGYSCGDLFFSETLLNAAENALESIISDTASLEVLTFIGLPVYHFGKIYNCAAAICKGKLLGIIPKSFTADYGEFSETRYFAKPDEYNTTIKYAGQSCSFGAKLVFVHEKIKDLAVSAEICEDVFSQIPPSTYHASAGATVIMNLSASSESVGKPEYRRSTVASHSRKNHCAYVYTGAGCGESTTDLIYSGHSFICEMGTLLAENLPFGDSQLIVSEADVSRIAYERRKTNTFECAENPEYDYIEFSTEIKDTILTRSFDAHPFVPSKESRNEHCSFILDMQASALARRMSHTRSKCVVLGISGGLDSTLAILVAVRSMKKLNRPASDVLAITMPCFGTGTRTKGNAEKLCEELGVSFRCIDIAAAVKQHLADIGHDDETYDIAFENAQARERTQVLMDIANAEGGIVLGTGDLSEAALGWATYNGDHMSMYNVNCDIPKTLVRCIVDYCADISDNKELTYTLKDILGTPISPELVPTKEGELGQKTEDIVGDYDLHDFFLYCFIEYGYTPEKILHVANICFADAFDEDHIRKVLCIFINRFFTQQFKRSCSPDGVKVNSVSLSPRGTWKMPSDAFSSAWINKIK